MKKLLALLNGYVLECEWKDLALMKTCICAFGVMLGLSLPREKKKPALAVSGVLFVASTALLAVRFLKEFCPCCAAETEEETADGEDEEGFIMRIVEEE
ncbi:permease of phosphate ABC transporter [Anaerotignum lactatifermentans]|uniref:Permease of phosphate ABC transporter n=1 Tax=Anaerotignum lactatifermentans TaxID=160404 RepID=A0ABS2G9Q3_9FIRM|nr:permease of phosphate ABC transporter [Anaerotignum lactatifermentans]MBM6828327.1 permease of phosphate ABC transporter [Anaerotignum lactatifermentans]MBM6877607.1 permease of phosphate ABC transporter [Anaerotignum lactatifermentans]MBM6949910.1 permease of phosphate ABC transporter [Anaerotignum lactatifermentans]